MSCDKGDPVEIKVGKIDVGWGWYDWKGFLVTEVGSKIRFNGVRQRYIIHDIKTQGWVVACDAKTDKERLVYLVPLHGTGYNTDNHYVWHKI